MALPTFDKTWIFDVNNAYTAQGSVFTAYQKLVYQLKTTICNPSNYPTAGTAAVVRSSSNSTIANTSDNWTSFSALNWNGTGGPLRSWIVIRLPGIGSTFDICIDCINTYLSGNYLNYTPYALCVTVSPGGYATTGLSVSSRPATVNGDEFVILNSGSSSTWGNADVPYIMHNWYSSDGTVQRHMVCQGFYPVMFCQFEVPKSPVTGWNSGANYPWIASYSASGAQGTNIMTDARFFQGANIAGRANGTNMAMYLTCESAANASLSNSMSVANQLSGEWDMLPAGIRSATAGTLGRHGQLYDLWYGLTSVTTGSTYPSVSDRRWAQFGSIILPWDSTQYVLTAG